MTRSVLALAAVLFLWNLGGTDVTAPDEPYFAEGAREMVVDGQWAVPHVNGKITTDKPPLFFWLIAIFSLPTGTVTSLTARLPSALAMLGAAALTMRLGRRLLGERAGAFAGLLFVTTYLVWDKARSSQIDALLCFLILVALSAFETLHAGRAESSRPAGLLFWLACALAVLAKGPVGVLLPLGIALVTLAWEGRLRAWGRFAPIDGPVLFAVVIGAWVALATIGGKGEYSVWGAFQEHALGRALHGMHHKQPPWYYLHVLPVQLLPWSGLIPGALVLAFRRKQSTDRFLLAWALFVVAFFTISTEKRDLYVLPAYPAFALLAGALVEEMIARAPRLAWGWLRYPEWLVSIVIALGGIALPFVARRFEVVPIAAAALAGAALAAAGGAGIFAVTSRRVRGGLAGVAGAIAAAYLIAATFILPSLDPLRSARTFASALTVKTDGARERGDEIVAFRLGNLPEALSFYTNGMYLRETLDPAVLAAHLSREAEAFAVVDAAQLGLLPSGLRSRLVVLASAQLNDKTVQLITATSGTPAN